MTSGKRPALPQNPPNDLRQAAIPHSRWRERPRSTWPAVLRPREPAGFAYRPRSRRPPPCAHRARRPPGAPDPVAHVASPHSPRRPPPSRRARPRRLPRIAAATVPPIRAAAPNGSGHAARPWACAPNGSGHADHLPSRHPEWSRHAARTRTGARNGSRHAGDVRVGARNGSDRPPNPLPAPRTPPSTVSRPLRGIFGSASTLAGELADK